MASEPERLEVRPDALVVPRLRDLASLLQTGDYEWARLLRCLSDADRDEGEGCSDSREEGVWEAVEVEVEVERPQHPVADIRATELVRIGCESDDSRYPRVLALREGFPSLLHQNLSTDPDERDLCLFDRAWRETRRGLTAAGLLDRIRWWLAAAARGELHADDQPLEPAFVGLARELILPREVVSSDGWSAPFRVLSRPGVFGRAGRAGLLVPFGENRTVPRNGDVLDGRYVFLHLTTPPAVQGRIKVIPRDLRVLCGMLPAEDYDLWDSFVSHVRDIPAAVREGVADLRLILSLRIPVERMAGSGVEVDERWAFLFEETFAEVVSRTGIAGEQDGRIVPLVGCGPVECPAEQLIEPLSVHPPATRDALARYSGRPRDDGPKVLVGAGALGSQMLELFARQGAGGWTVVDGDYLLPHNLARHTADDSATGWAKADVVALTPGKFGEEGFAAVREFTSSAPSDRLRGFLADAELVLDCSADRITADAIGDLPYGGRRASAFLSPSGDAAALLVEPSDRSVTLRGLDAQFLRLVGKNNLCDFYTDARATRLALGCGAVTAVMPAHAVATFAGLLCRAVNGLNSRLEGFLAVWRMRDDGIVCQRQSVLPTCAAEVGGWTIDFDEGLLASLREARSGRLPNETGGVLVGHHDHMDNRLTLVQALPAPDDSVERPFGFIRGSGGLSGELEAWTRRTGGAVNYVGEWHTHPEGCVTAPSDEDRTVLAWLDGRMRVDGLPAVMLIAGGEDMNLIVNGEEARLR